MRNTIHRVLNLALYLCFCLMIGTGLLLSLRLPPGSRGGRGLTVLDMDRHEWGDLHLWISYAFIALVLVHLMMNWVWLKKIAAQRRSWRLWAGLGGGVLVVLLIVLWPVEQTDRGWRHRQQVEQQP